MIFMCIVCVAYIFMKCSLRAFHYIALHFYYVSDFLASLAASKFSVMLSIFLKKLFIFLTFTFIYCLFNTMIKYF